MTQQNPDRRGPPPPVEPVWTMLPVGLIIVLTGCVMTTLLAKDVALGPSVGDVIVFQTAAIAPSVDVIPQVDVTARFAQAGGRAAATCALNPGTMAAGGGSLIIERRADDEHPSFQIHWAGKRTSDGAANCGNSADLVLPANDLLDLAGAAGGFGITHHALMSPTTPGAWPGIVN